MLWSIEYNWTNRTFHAEPLNSRLEKNISQILNRGRPTNPNWVLIGVVPQDEVTGYIDAFKKRLAERGR